MKERQSKRKIRTSKLTVALTPVEHHAIVEGAKKRGMSQGAYIGLLAKMDAKELATGWID